MAVAMCLLLAACGDDDSIPGYEAFARQVGETRIGRAADQWIEMRNDSGEWERTGLIFGYVDDYDECTKAISGLKRVNSVRDYRCIPAN